MYDEDKKVYVLKIHKESIKNDAEIIDSLINKIDSLNAETYSNGVRIYFEGYENHHQNLQDVEEIYNFCSQLYFAYDGLFYWLDIDKSELDFWWQMLQNSHMFARYDLDNFIADILQRLKHYCENNNYSSYTSVLLVEYCREKLENELLKEAIANKDYNNEFNDKLRELYYKIIVNDTENTIKEIVNKIISEFQSMKGDKFLLSGDDAGLENTWDEICVNVQGEESVWWDEYQNAIRLAVKTQTEKLAFSDLFNIWLLTEEFNDWSCNDSCTYTQGQEYSLYNFYRKANEYFDDEGYPNDFSTDDVEQYIYQQVISEAANYTNKKIEDYLERSWE